jgi:hypothetical protein
LCGVPETATLSTPSYGKMNCVVVVRTVMLSYCWPLTRPVTVVVVAVPLTVALRVPLK